MQTLTKTNTHSLKLCWHWLSHVVQHVDSCWERLKPWRLWAAASACLCLNWTGLRGMAFLPLPRESWAPCLESFLLWLLLPQTLAGLLLQAERADPFSFLISMHSVSSHGEVQSHLPRPGSGFTGWHHLSPEAHAPRPCRHMSSGLDEVELCWQWMPLSLPPLSLTVPWGFLFGRAGERWEAEEGHYGWAFHWLMEQIRLSLNGRSTQCFTLEYAGFKII